ncbi:glycoside hydrolase family 78 protein [Paenibacillus pasadenensis]|uniref:alpha-L-rhamnosidase n=1 Tax=Paenibacillus pasadenensis TaxID=217090 RepID=UPI00203A7AB5|nr:alpha-L-rhamnosidase [Paenibacillus pasadenensis]MCM3745733.1 glycoside hydrolase family 78 protein [Paenibacillus pasadenensis]
MEREQLKAVKSYGDGTFQIEQVKVEYAVNPIAVNSLKPRFSWGFRSSRQNERQTAYQIVVADSSEALNTGQALIWDSGKVDSAENAGIQYAGPQLQSGRRYLWKIRAWDGAGNASDYSESGTWEMALLHTDDWKAAKWIGVTEKEQEEWTGVSGDEIKSAGLPIFRKEFQLNDSVKRAKIYLCGLGQFELRLNGGKVSDNVLSPGWTHYDHTCLYSTFDVTEQLQAGNNAVGIMLGNGFYHVAGGRYAKYLGSFGLPKLIFQLHAELMDGTVVQLYSDEEWSVSHSPVTFSCMYGGEDYNALLEQDGWDQADFAQDGRWKQASLVSAPSGTLQSEQTAPLKVMRRFAAELREEGPDGSYVYDFKQNFSGWVKIAVKGPAGATVTLTSGELLYEDGTVSQETSKGPSYFSYTLKGDGVEVWAPRFSYTGFRYMQVEGAIPASMQGTAASDSGASIPVLLDIEGEMIYPDVATVGSFECSNEMWNRTHEIINWAILSNMKSVLTDCPHREKLGWLEQVHLMGPSIMYNYDVAGLYNKIIGDMRDSQTEEGLIPDIAPEYTVFEGGFRDSPEWGAAYILATWYAYNWYGDTRLLEEHYDGMKRYVEYLSTKADGYILRHGLGDWCDVGPDPGFAQNTPVPLTATATYYYAADTMGKIALLLGSTSDAAYFEQLALQIKSAFNAHFWNEAEKQYATGSQTSHAFPLAVGLVPKEQEEDVMSQLISDIQAHGDHLTGGDVGFRYLLMALLKFDQPGIVSRILSQTEDPSYGFQLLNGATTLTERWDGPVAGHSQNHFMLGHAEEWFYSGLAGIRIPYDESSRRIVNIAPRFVEEIEWVKAHHELIQGKIEVSWERKETNQLQLNVSLPVNTTGVIELADVRADQIHASEEVRQLKTDGRYTSIEVGSGRYSFSIVLN